MSKAQKHMQKVAANGCVVCRRLFGEYVPCQIHHVAEGSGVRSDFAVAGLCPEHHLGATGFHRGPKSFLKLFRVPWELETGLLVWVNEDLA